MQIVTLAYWLLLSGIADLIAALIGAILVYKLARRRLTVLGAAAVTPVGILAGIVALYWAERLFATLAS